MKRSAFSQASKAESSAVHIFQILCNNIPSVLFDLVLGKSEVQVSSYVCVNIFCLTEYVSKRGNMESRKIKSGLVPKCLPRGTNKLSRALHC